MTPALVRSGGNARGVKLAVAVCKEIERMP